MASADTRVLVVEDDVPMRRLLVASLEVHAGGRTTLDVHVDRRGGFDAPVLVELAGLPDGLFTQAREARVGDTITQLIIEAGDDAPPIEMAPCALPTAMSKRRFDDPSCRSNANR